VQSVRTAGWMRRLAGATLAADANTPPDWPAGQRLMARLLLGNVLRGPFERSKALRHALWRIEAGTLAALLWLLRRLSPERASALGARLFGWLGPHHPKHRILERNLALAFPERTPAEIDRLARRAWANIGAVLAEYALLDRICAPDSGRVEVTVLGPIAAFSDPQHPAIFVSAHLANWEVGPAPILRRGVPLTVVHTPLQNPYLQALLERSRGRLGTVLVPRDNSVRPFVRELAAGHSIGMIVDQRVDSGEPVPMFGIAKATTLVPARLCLRFGAELVPLRVERLGPARFRVTFHPPVRPRDPMADPQDQALDMMRQVNALFERWIREAPGDWFCSKRRWPKDLWKAGR
jgi:Kdo2-lipid IVA lauroyltransferase/acyltransferase